jgi:SAM-dependent methyltransferase
MNLDERTSRVREMYSKYPFPLKGNHDDYVARVLTPVLTQLQQQHPIARLLEAGCGTGNITADIAASLPGTAVTAVDLTESSLALAKERAEERQLRNITFQQSNLLEHDPALGVFDFIYSQGVIHHLTDPLTGMKNLNRYLKPDRHALVWLYTLLGRRRILEMREALKILGVDALGWEEKIQLANAARPIFLSQKLTFLRKVIKVLERLDRHGFQGLTSYLKSYFTKSSYGGTHVADQILHPQDKFYRIADAIQMFEAAGFELVQIVSGMSDSLTGCFGDEPLFAGKKISRLDAYTLIELHEQPEGVGFLIQKKREVN